MGKYLVCLDPGHGPGNGNGSPDGTYKEYQFAWDMYERISKLLKTADIDVIGTKTESQYPSLTARANVSNKAGADLFISIHSNAAGNGGWYNSASGFIAYTSSGPDSALRNQAAKAIINQVSKAGIKLFPTSLAHEKFTVLTATTAPAVLLECAFHTSQTDVANLKSSAWRDKLANAVFLGVCDFFDIEIEDGSGESGQPDIPDSWATTAWEKASKKLSVDGTVTIMDGTRPRDNITRQEHAVILDRLGLLD